LFFVLLLCAPFAYAEESDLIADAYCEEDFAVYCQEREDAEALAGLYVINRPAADELLKAKIEKSLCAARATSYIVGERIAVKSGPGGVMNVVMVKADNGIHFLVTPRNVVTPPPPDFVPGTRYGGKVVYCKNLSAINALVEAAKSGPFEQAQKLLAEKEEKKLCRFELVDYVVVREISVHKGDPDLHVIEVVGRSEHYYILSDRGVAGMSVIPSTSDVGSLIEAVDPSGDGDAQ